MGVLNGRAIDATATMVMGAGETMTGMHSASSSPTATAGSKKSGVLRGLKVSIGELLCAILVVSAIVL